MEKHGRVDPDDTPTPERIKQATIATEAARRKAIDELARDDKPGELADRVKSGLTRRED